ncbi:hypothetical protein IF188_15615 [Microbacterium sp. NEAU-LLC]|uniref:CU044_5270 family protein n=1 Tax=Microbacterium helvum TaxID=2773713 RepID=A0ABR8NVN4_9MICO|nr:hypothetical protein [Microbacterium helvum]MBD3943121.1 hypothetical protein [Microbacterium helvum]
MTDDEFDALLRSADPARTPLDTTPGPADRARLHAIMAASPQRTSAGPVDRLRAAFAAARRTSARPALRWSGALAVVAIVVAGALGIASLTAAPAYAQTPPLLVVEHLDQSIDDVLAASISVLRSAPERVAGRDAEVVRWALREDGSDDPVIVPEWQRWVWNSDGTGQLEATAGAPYSVTSDGRIVAPAGDAPTEGQPIVGPRSEAGRYGYFPDEPPADPAALRAYFAERTGLAPDADALAVWGAVSALRDEWSLSPAQQAAALELLRDAGGLRVLGHVTDRFGREGIALQVASTDRPDFSATVVLDADSREIIAADIVYRGDSGRIDVPKDSVIEYSVWLRR